MKNNRNPCGEIVLPDPPYGGNIPMTMNTNMLSSGGNVEEIYSTINDMVKQLEREEKLKRLLDE